jgi:hypothetical protein
MFAKAIAIVSIIASHIGICGKLRPAGFKSNTSVQRLKAGPALCQQPVLRPRGSLYLLNRQE